MSYVAKVTMERAHKAVLEGDQRYPVGTAVLVPHGQWRDIKDALRACDPGYQGWTNWETWIIRLHLSNTQAFAEAATRMSALAEADKDDGMGGAYEAAQRLRAWVEQMIHANQPTAGQNPIRLMIGDIIQGVLGDCNWEEVAASFREE